jgi:hypothetical protein
MLHYFFVVVQFNEAEMECAYFAAVDEAHVQRIVVKIAAQAHAPAGDVFAGREFGVTDIERLRVAFLANRVEEMTERI